MTLKTKVKSVLSPVVRAAWPVVETMGELEARARRGPIDVRWFTHWNSELDQALEALPPLLHYPHALYRELLKPTTTPKKHALVSENGKVTALISLRQTGRHWEPVAYQCAPGAIAPAVSDDGLARALIALGVEVRVPAGLGPEVKALNPTVVWAYDCYAIDLTADYEAYWRSRKRQSRLRKALRESEHFQRRIDAAGDLEWTLEQWREQWKDDPSQEVVAVEDRLNFWKALAARASDDLSVHTLALADGAKRVAGLIVLCKGGVAKHQCISRDAAYSDAGTAVNLLAVDWAKSQGLGLLDFGGGAYKRDWGPPLCVRYGAAFRPRVMSALSWACA